VRDSGLGGEHKKRDVGWDTEWQAAYELKETVLSEERKAVNGVRLER